MDVNALHRLAERLGIADHYHDIWGTRHPTTDETRRRLLAAMGMDPDRAEAELERLDAEDWQRLLPPVLASAVGRPVDISVTIPGDSADAFWYWRLRADDGVRPGESPACVQHADRFRPVDGRVVAECELAGRRYLRYALDLPPIEAPGYYLLELSRDQDGGRTVLGRCRRIVAPVQCHQPAARDGDRRTGGPARQLYGLRSQRNWGIGDFGDLAQLIELSADMGAGVVGLNPLHALFTHDPARASPYSPSSRCFLNVLYLDVEAIPEFSECVEARARVGEPAFQARLARLRQSDLVNYVDVAAAKFEVLGLLYRQFCDRHLATGSERAQAFSRFRAARGVELERHALFEAIQAHCGREDAGIWGWPVWPESLRDPDGDGVAAFAAGHGDAVNYHAWLQWLVDEQLQALGQACLGRQMAVGLYLDLALGVNPGGAEVWAWQGVFAQGAHAGAPPDDFNLLGQEWGLPPFVPHRLRAAGYAPMIAALRANMRHAGALRIDHVMALARLFWVPAGRPPAEGAYVSYPFEEMLAVVSLEGWRHGCLVIGEDLGTVPDGFRPRLAEAGLLSYRPFLFERTPDQHFKPPADYPRAALVTLSTHDLPTLAGFWCGSDIEQRAALGLFFSDSQADALREARARDRVRVLEALAREGLLPAGMDTDPGKLPYMTDALALAIQTYLARTPAKLLVVQPEDIFCLAEQANVPGSLDHQHPNWRRRLPVELDTWRDDDRVRALYAALRRERG
ncbi:MAG: 4-alpha-glucanotransferase [Betaproteobacteria bacterium]